MTNGPNSQVRMRSILVIVATIATIAFNGLAATGYVNGVTPAMVSESNPSIITPAGYAFTIWSVIYLWLLAFSVYQFLHANIPLFRSIRTLYILSCVLNCLWLWFWQYGEIGVCLVVISALVGVLFLINRAIRATASFRDSFFTKAPLGIYFGLVTCAMLINLNIFVTHVREERSFLVSLGVISIIFATIASVLVRWKLDNYLYSLAVAWTLTAIAVKQGFTPIVIAAAFGTVTCLVTAGSIVTNLKDSTSE